MANRNLARRVARKTASVCGDICIIGCVIIVLPFWCVGKICIKSTQAIQHHSRQGDRCYLASESTHPIPLPFQRRFNLSNQNLTSTSQPVESRLMQLPYDVRRLIWSFAVANYELQIEHTKGEQRLHHYSEHRGRVRCRFDECPHSKCAIDACHYCLLAEQGAQSSQLTIETDPQSRPKKLKRWKGKSKPDQPRELCCTPVFALLKTCRQIYQECIPLVYKDNRFGFSEINTVPFWIQSVRKHHVARVRKIQLRFTFAKPTMIKDWISACFCIATWMKSLEEMDIELTLTRSFSIVERALIDHLKEISGLKRFSLQIMYSGEVAETQEMRQYRKIIRQLVMRPRGTPWERLFLELLLKEWRKGRALGVAE